MHESVDLKVLYFGTPVVLISSLNEDGTANVAPMSSAWWLGRTGVLGLDNTSQTTVNLLREREAVLNLASASMVEAVDRLAMLTGTPVVPAHKERRGYRYEPDKFSAAGLTALPAHHVRAPRVRECPIHLECRVRWARPLGGDDSDASLIEVEVIHVHVDDQVRIAGKDHVDPVAWDPLIMKFCEFFGHSRQVHPSRLAAGWDMPHAPAI